MSHRVLVVEDDADLLELIRFKLSNGGFEVLGIEDGERAWEFLSEDGGRPDAIVLDVMLPGMDGFALLKRIKRHEELEDVPVLMLTAVGDEDDMVEAMEVGAEDYVRKPFSPSVLQARVRRLVE